MIDRWARARRTLLTACSILGLLGSGCSAVPPVEAAAANEAAPKTDGAAVVAEPRGADVDAIPVSLDDPSRGSPDALVTIVVFYDFECPHCRSSAGTLSELSRAYGPDELRVVYKSFPIEGHASAKPAATLGAALRAVGGDAAFFSFYDAVMGPHQDDETMDHVLARGMFEAAKTATFAPEDLGREIASSGAAKVEADLELAERLGVRSTPTFFINGLRMQGAAPVGAFREVIDAELTAAKRLVGSGTPRARIYEERVAQNFAAPAPRVEEKPEAPPIPPQDPTVWKVPVGDSPSEGPKTAPVTVVVFSDFECVYCSAVAPTLKELRRTFGDKVRLVYKHNPLPRHARAEPAAELAAMIYAEKGAEAFWKAHDSLFAREGSLSDRALSEIAADAGLEPKRALAAIDGKKLAKVIAADRLLADDVDVNSTPQVFINGLRVVGAQPKAVFIDRVGTALADAEKRLAAGTPADKLYETIVADGESLWPPPRVDAPALDASTPVRGPAGAPVLMQVFADFECPFCARHHATLAELDKRLPGKLRVAWRNDPLPRHSHAKAAAAVAIEVRKQKGDAAFWKLADALFASQDDLGDEALVERAKALGADADAVRTALSSGKHAGAIEADMAVASRAGISGTPTTIVGPYVVVGAASVDTLERVARLVISDRKGQPAKQKAEPATR
jgi:protein-disulfide isomerase